MDWMAILSTLFVLGPVIAILVIFAMARRKYKNRGGAGAFFFENGCLVLNTGLPYPIPLEDIRLVELGIGASALLQPDRQGHPEKRENQARVL